jgi:hypothetical protein
VKSGYRDAMVKKIRSKQAVSEVIGIVLLLGITISLFTILNFSVFHFSFNPSVPSVNLIGTIDKANNIINIEHNGGESLEENTEIIITIGNTSYQKSVSWLLNDTTADEWNFTKTNSDNKWNFGETVRFHSPELITNKYIRVTVMDPTTNSLVLSVALQQR